MRSHMNGETRFQDVPGEYSGNLQEGFETMQKSSRKHEMAKTPIKKEV